MKNIHLIPTDKRSRLYLVKSNNKLDITSNNPDYTENFGSGTQNQHIYITSDEEIKQGDWCYQVELNDGKVDKCYDITLYHTWTNNGVDKTRKFKKIILTTDKDLIKDGVQAIDDEFLEWVVNNPTCEEVEVIYGLYNPSGRKVNFEILNQNHSQCVWKYKIIIPKQEPKQEQKQHLIDIMQGDEELGLYEDSTRYAHNNFNMHETNNYQALKQGYEAGATEMAKKRYSEEEVKSAYAEGGFAIMRYLEGKECLDVDKWFEQFKKK